MSEFFIVLVVLVFLMALVPYNNGQQYIEDDSDLEVIRSCQNGYVRDPLCGENEHLNIIIAVTLNGAVTALDGETGELMWRYEDAPMLQGTLNNAGPIDIGGTSLQLMPTLDGRLFSYSQQINLIEPLPITTESLLESTIRLGQDAVAGGKSVTTKGFDLFTGEKKYECSVDSCGNPDAELPQNPIILVKRITNSIRAMDTLRGVERWNLSTAEVDVSLAGGITVQNLDTSENKFLLQPPDGVVVAMENKMEKWKTAVDGHIVNVWHVNGNTIGEISIFNPSNIYTTQFEVMHREERNLKTQSSLLYMGTSDGYPFIIQSPKAKRNLKKKMSSLPELSSMTEITNPRFCSANSVTSGLAYQIGDTGLKTVLEHAFKHSQSKAIEDKSSKSAASRGKLQIVAPNDDPNAQKISTENLRSTSLSKGGDYGYLVLESETRIPRYRPPSPINFVQTIFSYVINPTAVISLCTGLIGVVVTIVYNQLIKPTQPIGQLRDSSDSSDSELILQSTPSTSFAPGDDELDQIGDDFSDLRGSPFPAEPPVPVSSRALVPLITEKSNIEVHSPPVVHIRKRKAKTDLDTDDTSVEEEDQRKLMRNRTISRSSLEGFTSRFSNEFEVKKVIGQGGFGVVFRAKSALDMNEYAVKRIAVADNDKARNRVLREARALALIDHPAIIRYFYAWEERPPKGYQEDEDRKLFGKMKAERLAKLKQIKKEEKNASQAPQVKSADSASFAGTFEMPPVIGKTTEDSWSADIKPQEVGAKRTTSESKRGLNGESDTTAEIPKDRSVRFASSDDESDTTEDSEESSSSSSSSLESSLGQQRKYSSSGGIEFRNETEENGEEVQKVKDEIAVIDQQMSLKKEIIVATENEELEVQEASEHGECAYLYIVMQLCAEKTLEHWIKRNMSVESRNLIIMKDWIKQLASGLDYLHIKGFIHRDLKPGNVFFSLDSTEEHKILKIGDLGLATKTDGAPRITVQQDSEGDLKHTRNVGTRSYMSPEQLNHQQYTQKVDIFALGLVATELIIPFATSMERIHTFQDYQKGVDPQILNNYPDSRDFLKQLTETDPSKRPSAKQVFTHKFLQ